MVQQDKKFSRCRVISNNLVLIKHLINLIASESMKVREITTAALQIISVSLVDKQVESKWKDQIMTRQFEFHNSEWLKITLQH